MRIRASLLSTATAVLFTLSLQPAMAQPDAGTDTQANDDAEKLSLQVATPEEGFALAITLARKGVTETQPDTEVLHGLRPEYSHDPDSLIAVSHVVAVHFQTIAAANDYWRD